MPQTTNRPEDLTCLIRQAQAGNHAAFDQIVRRFQDRAVGYGYALLGDFHRAEDAAQDAFLQAYHDLPTLREPVTFPHWLNRIVFKCCDRLTRRRQVPTVALEAAEELVCPHTGSDPAKALEALEQRTELHHAIWSLAASDRTVIVLFYLGEHSQAEIAEFVRVPIATIKKRLQRARTRLKEKMKMIENKLRETAPSLTTRFAETASLLRRMVDLLKQDTRVVAAYLAHFGADEGFGPDDDAWSSLNVHVILADDAMDAMATGRRDFVARLAPPLLHVEAPQNAPPVGGYYLMTLYDGDAGPYEVDWYWHSQSSAFLPQDTRLLFDRVGLPTSGQKIAWGFVDTVPDALARVEAAKTDSEKQAAEIQNKIHFFWAMLLITAKYVARDPYEERMGFAPMLRNLLAKIRASVGETAKENEDLSPTPHPAAKLALLRSLAGEMETRMRHPSLSLVEIPFAIVPRVYAFLAMIEEPFR